MEQQINSMRDMFVHNLRGAYHMERRLVGILDEMAENATNDKIATGFADHRDETERHVERLEEVFQALGETPEERDCPIVEALDQERRTVEAAVSDPDLLNMFYLGAGMKTERIEITTYESLLLAADRLDMDDDVTDRLEANLDNEESTLKELRSMSKASDLKSLWQKLMP